MILVTGAMGMVGNYLTHSFATKTIYPTDVNTMDITDHRAVMDMFARVKPMVVLHLAAATDVDLCEVDPDLAFRINMLGTQNVVMACRQHNALMVYISTGSVFNGNKISPYTEFDDPDPISVYARSKWEGEKLVEKFLDRYFIVRAGWMIGGGEKDKKFVAKMVELCRTQDEIRVVEDRVGTITYAKDLIRVLQQLIETPYYGIYHVANQGVCTRYDVALEIARILQSSVKVIPVSSAFFPLPAPRGRSEAILNYKLKLLGRDDLSSWQVALRNYLKEWMIL